MVAISATNSATPSQASAISRNRLEQARRDAGQAETRAQNLRAQADAAELDAQKSQGRVRDLASRSQQADPTYAPQVEGDKSEVTAKTQDFLVGMYSATSENRTASGNPLKTSPNSAPVLNIQGQSTGRIVNISA